MKWHIHILHIYIITQPSEATMPHINLNLILKQIENHKAPFQTISTIVFTVPVIL